MARRLGDPASLAYVLLERFFTIVAPSTLDERLDDTAELLSLAEAMGDPTMTAQALILHVRNNAEAGRFEEADRHLAAAERLAAELGQPTLRWFVGHSRAVRVLLAGDLVEAERLIHAKFELGQATGQADARAFFAGQLFLLRFEQGRLGELEGQTVEAVADHPLFQAYLALLLCESGRSDEARVVYEGLAGTDFSALPLDNAWMMGISACTLVAARLGDRPGATVLHGLLDPYGDQFVFAYGGAWGAVAHYLGLLAATLDRFDEAEARFAAGAETHERNGMPTWLARTRCEWAAMLARRGEPGDAERARDLLDRALATARDLGLASVERRVVALLSAR